MENVLLRRSYSTSTDVAELSLLLPGWQMHELAETAAARGMTVGQLMRGYIQQILSQALQPFPKNVEN